MNWSVDQLYRVYPRIRFFDCDGFDPWIPDKDYVIESRQYQYHKLAKWGYGDQAQGTHNSQDLKQDQVSHTV